jgi:hypothetical protein
MAFEPRELSLYVHSTEQALKQLSLESLQHLIHNTAHLDMDEISHKLCLLRREDTHQIHYPIRITPITPHIQSKLVIVLRDRDSRQQMKLYRKLAALSSNVRGMTSSIFEAFCLQRFKKQIVIDCVPMVRLDGDGRERKRRWRTNYRPFTSKTLEEIRQAALDNSFTLDVRPRNTCKYSDKDFRKLHPRPDIYPPAKEYERSGLRLIHLARWLPIHFSI